MNAGDWIALAGLMLSVLAAAVGIAWRIEKRFGDVQREIAALYERMKLCPCGIVAPADRQHWNGHANDLRLRL